MWRTIAHIGTGTAFIVLLALGLVLLLLKQTDSRALSVQSGSMAPAIQEGDLIVVNKSDHYEVGDVVTFINSKDQSSTITHRVVDVRNNGRVLQTKGDANQMPDEPIGIGSVKGKAAYRIPYLGNVVDALRHPVGLLLSVYVPALMIVVYEMRRLANYYGRHSFSLRRQQTVRQRRMASLLRSGAVAVLLAPLALSGPVYAALQSSATLTGNTISSVTVPQRYEVCMFPEWRNLMSYAPGDALYPLPHEQPLALEQPILPGTYRITAESSDDHLAHPNEPDQPVESWFLQLYTGSSESPAYQTGATDDLPQDMDEINSTMNESITFTETINAIRYAHAVWPDSLEIDQFGGRPFDSLTETEKRSVVWHSIHPGCVTFTRLPADEQL